jgi:hypothetical protein
MDTQVTASSPYTSNSLSKARRIVFWRCMDDTAPARFEANSSSLRADANEKCLVQWMFSQTPQQLAMEVSNAHGSNVSSTAMRLQTHSAVAKPASAGSAFS